MHQQVQLHANNMHSMHPGEMQSSLFQRKEYDTGLIHCMQSHALILNYQDKIYNLLQNT